MYIPHPGVLDNLHGLLNLKIKSLNLMYSSYFHFKRQQLYNPHHKQFALKYFVSQFKFDANSFFLLIKILMNCLITITWQVLWQNRHPTSHSHGQGMKYVLGDLTVLYASLYTV